MTGLMEKQKGKNRKMGTQKLKRLLVGMQTSTAAMESSAEIP